MFLAALSHIEKTVPEVMVNDSEAPRRVRVAVGAAEQTFDLGGLDQLWEVTMALRDIFRFLQQHIVDYDERRQVEYAAINGMLSTLDPHSLLLPPESYAEMKLSTTGEFGGLGIVISLRGPDKELTVISPIEGTPAYRAGIRAGDVISAIEGETTAGISMDDALKKRRGRKGTEVSITVSPAGVNEPYSHTLVRADITTASIPYSFMIQPSVGYIRIKNFTQTTDSELDEKISKLDRKFEELDRKLGDTSNEAE